MASIAFCFKGIVPVLFGKAEAGLAAFHLVVFTVERYNAPGELGQGFQHSLAVDCIVTEGVGKHPLVGTVGIQFGDDITHRLRHLVHICNGRKRLNFDMVCTPIPLHFLHPGQVKHTRRIAKGKGIVKSMTELVIVGGKSCKLLVAARTGKIAILAEPPIVKKLSSQLESLFG